MNNSFMINLLILIAAALGFGFSYKSAASYFCGFIVVIELLLLLHII